VANPYLDEGHAPERFPWATTPLRCAVRSVGVNQHDLDRARRLVDESAKVVVLTGAGVSTASGIPDFRGPEGVWTKDPAAERLSDIDAFTSSSEIREQAWGRLLSRRGVDVQPNPAHFALVAFERTGKLTALVTQNIDGLHVKAGSDPQLVIEVHGNSRTTRCLRCGDELPTTTVLERVVAGERDPHCHVIIENVECGGLLKTAVVSFGQPLPAGDFARAEYLAKTCDLLICIGSTLSVRPVAGLVPKALDRGAKLIIINAEATPFDQDADVVLRGDIPIVLGELFGTTP
jgi:NAD-dependent deacetylase